jgi:hypothetical protein
MAATRVLPLPGAAAATKAPEDIASLIIEIDKQNSKQMVFMKDILCPRLIGAGLSVSSRDGVLSVDGSQSIFLQVYASVRRLLAEAQRQDVSFRLSSSVLRQADIAVNLELSAAGVVFAPAGSPESDFAIPKKIWSTWSLQTNFDPYAFIFAEYDPA